MPPPPPHTWTSQESEAPSGSREYSQLPKPHFHHRSSHILQLVASKGQSAELLGHQTHVKRPRYLKENISDQVG